MSREGTRKHDLCIQLIIIQCCSNFCYIVTFTALLNCWLILTSCCKTHRKMLVFDRPSIFPFILVFLPCSPLYSLFFHFDTSAYCLVAWEVSLSMLDTHPCFIIP